jgi:general secretion pathway protein J
MMKNRYNRQAGFTLLELLISITIIGIIVIIISNAFRLGFRSIEMGEKTIESLERLRSSFRIISSQIYSELPIKYDFEGQKEYYLKGDKKFLQFASNYSIFGGQRGYVLVKYTVEQDSAGKDSLYASETIIGIEDEKKVKLLSNYDEISFEYFLKDLMEEQGEWAEEINEDEQKILERIMLHVIDRQKKYTLVFPVRTVRQQIQRPLLPGEGF